MSELQIRINKRTLERALALVIIIVLAVLLINQSGGEVNSEELDELQAQVANLTAQNEALTNQVSTLQASLNNAQEELSALEEPESEVESQPEAQPEPELSGVLTFDYDYSTSGGQLNAFTVEINNGLETNRALEVRVNWQGGVWGDVPPKIHDVLVRSGEREIVLVDDLARNPGSGVDTVRVVVRDEDGSVVEQEHVRIF